MAALLQQLHIKKAAILGFSNGGNTAMQIAIRHPQLVYKLIVASSFYKRAGMYPWFWEFMKNAGFEHMPQGLKDAYLEVTPDPIGLQEFLQSDANAPESPFP